MIELHLPGEAATPPSARTGRHLAVLQLVAIAGYCASLCLARHHPARTLDGVQLPFLG
jgi:hypothetical protein